MELAEIKKRVAAKALYSGGWRSGDQKELEREYEYTADEAAEMCELLAELEAEDAR